MDYPFVEYIQDWCRKRHLCGDCAPLLDFGIPQLLRFHGDKVERMEYKICMYFYKILKRINTLDIILKERLGFVKYWREQSDIRSFQLYKNRNS